MGPCCYCLFPNLAVCLYSKNASLLFLQLLLRLILIFLSLIGLEENIPALPSFKSIYHHYSHQKLKIMVPQRTEKIYSQGNLKKVEREIK
jgi:hypothetical protein